MFAANAEQRLLYPTLSIVLRPHSTFHPARLASPESDTRLAQSVRDRQLPKKWKKEEIEGTERRPVKNQPLLN